MPSPATTAAFVSVSPFISSYSKRATCRRRHGTFMCTPDPPNTQSVPPSSSSSSSLPPPRNAEELESRVRETLSSDGINYDLLMNAPKVLALYRDLEALKLSPDPVEFERLTRELERERRQTMKGWLINLFGIQAAVTCVIGGVLAFNVTGDFPLVLQALGFWTVWLFTVPSLRARKGLPSYEKSALNVAFLGMPLLNIGMAALTRECGVIWGADVVLLAVLYLYYGVKSVDSTDASAPAREEGKVTGVLRYLDWGSWR